MIRRCSVRGMTATLLNNRNVPSDSVIPMSLSLASLLLLLEAAAAVAGKTVVQEATKSAYGKIKGKFSELLGRRGSDQLAAIEANPKDENAREQLEQTVQSLTEREQQEIAPLAQALLAALRQDPGAQKLAQEVAAIRLDVTGENVTIQRIEGASIIDIRADAKKDFTLGDIKMKGSTDPGN